MLLDFQCSNHKSIKESVSFSMLAGSDDTYEKSLINFDKFRVSRTAVIYGPNGSGKSSLINALNFMQELVTQSHNFEIDMPVPQHPHKLSKKGTPSEYDIQFVYNGIRYAYGFSIREGIIHTEYLYYFPNNKQTKIFERNGMAIKPGDKYKNKFTTSIEQVLRKNRLFLSCAANFSKVKEVIEPCMFLKKEYLRYSGKGLTVFTEKSASYFDIISSLGIELTADILERSKLMKKSFIEMLQALGINVMDIKFIKRERARYDDPRRLRKSRLFDESMDASSTEVRIVYDQFETDLEKEESRGVKRLFQMLYPMLMILNRGGVLVFDEMESSLHECLLFEIVKLFQKFKKNTNAQLIFSTHNTNLLDSDLFRRDQVWFTELNDERATDLYSLVEIKNVRKSENLAKGYISGKYGAIPMLNKNILKERH